MSNCTSLRGLGLAALLAVAVLSSPTFQGDALAAGERDSDVPATELPTAHQAPAGHGATERQPVTHGFFVVYPDILDPSEFASTPGHSGR